MNPAILSDVEKLSNQELLAQVQILARREREATTALIVHLAVLDERQLFLGAGCSSLFTYCTQILHFSEHAAYNRIETARAARKYPVILEMLADGSVNLTTVRLLAPELTPANHRELLEAARHKSKRQVEELVAHLRPQPPVPSTIRRLPGEANDPLPNTAPVRPAASQSTPLQPPMPVRPPIRPAVVPLAPQRYKVQFTASAETHAKLRRAQDLLRHQIPDGDLGKVVEMALTVLIQDLERKKIGSTAHPQASRSSHSTSRHIPAEVRRTVWERDNGTCAFVGSNGRRCTEQAFLEFHHVVPYSAGGLATVDNIELRCRAHNGYEAELYFGSTWSGVS